ncbi:MAG: hypothetical protein ACLRM8_01940 [Alistipes sp.]
MEILSEIDKMLGAYKGLSVVSTDSHYAIPFKYTFEGGVFRLYVDRAMMLPYVKLLKDVLGGLGLDPSQMMGLDPAVILDDLFNATTELQIAVYLKNVIRGFADLRPSGAICSGWLFREPPKTAYVRTCLCFCRRGCVSGRELLTLGRVRVDAVRFCAVLHAAFCY